MVGQHRQVQPIHQRVEPPAGAQGVAQTERPCGGRGGGRHGEMAVAVGFALAHRGAGYLHPHRGDVQHQGLQTVAAVHALQRVHIHTAVAVGAAIETDAVALHDGHRQPLVIHGPYGEVQRVDAGAGRVVIHMSVGIGTAGPIGALVPAVAAAGRVSLRQVGVGGVVHRQVQRHRAVAACRRVGVVGGSVRAFSQGASVPLIAAARRHLLLRADAVVHRQVQLIDAITLHGIAQRRGYRVAVGAALAVGVASPVMAVARLHKYGGHRAAHRAPLPTHPGVRAAVAVGLDGIVAGDARVHARKVEGRVVEGHDVVAAVGVVERHSVVGQRVAHGTVVVPVHIGASVAHAVHRHKQRRQAAGGVHHDEGVVQHCRAAVCAVHRHQVHDALLAAVHLRHFQQVRPRQRRKAVHCGVVAEPVHQIGILFIEPLRGDKEDEVF